MSSDEQARLAIVIFDALKAQDVGYCERDVDRHFGGYGSACLDGHFDLFDVAAKVREYLASRDKLAVT